MFSGIVQGICKINHIEDLQGLRRIEIKLGKFASGLKTGASVSVNGVCLTVVAVGNKSARFEIIDESLKKTNLDLLKEDGEVNIERALRFQDEIGGHHVLGHVDVTGDIRSVHETENNCKIEIKCGPEWTKYLVVKGWITIDGISLTVVEVSQDWFSVCLIPDTLKRTLMGKIKMGDRVNLEFDYTSKVLVSTIERMLPDIEKRFKKDLMKKND